MKYLILFLLTAFNVLATEKHLFILSGQSNMARLNPEAVFTPSVVEALGKDKVIVVHDALGGAPIRLWDKEWPKEVRPPAGNAKKKKEPLANAALYKRLISKVNKASQGEKLASITFVWMQGEQDSQGNGDVYEASLLRVMEQLKSDLNYKDLNFVLGRLSDYGIGKKKNPDWQQIREIQVKLAEASPRGAWVNTDDLNSGADSRGRMLKDNIHYSKEGYALFAKRLAEAAIKLVKAHDLK